MSGVTKYSGWITAFCFWDDKGSCLHKLPASEQMEAYSDSAPFGDMTIDNFKDHIDLHLMLDGVRYHKVSDDEIPRGWNKVPVAIDDNGENIKAEMVAGSVGISCLMSGIENESSLSSLDTMQPQSGW
ncbi:hypothetical protein HYALB_00008442 [Hymenoscyphus albidus]|uniref:Uncharacterized protein n=1 Tax=Hymenoscyphus albidus TaxID=595503 RepID=A0A9N9PVS2_9HELO|nr:hypothetical protein HYALB_00008442 [Hymenoscyphus albidus]